MKFKASAIVLVVLFMVSQVFAQEQDSANGFELGFQAGKILPDQIPGVTEIMSSWGMRGGLRLTNYNLEAGILSASGFGANLMDLSLSLRADIPVEDLFGLVYMGVDVTKYSSSVAADTTVGGGHVGCGLYMKLAQGIFFRSDMKFNFNPGVAMFILFGLTFDFYDSAPGNT